MQTDDIHELNALLERNKWLRFEISQARANSIALDVAAVCELLDDDMRAIARLIAHEQSRADGLTITLPCPAAQLRETLYHDADGLRIHTDTAGRTYITNLE